MTYFFWLLLYLFFVFFTLGVLFAWWWHQPGYLFVLIMGQKVLLQGILIWKLREANVALEVASLMHHQGTWPHKRALADITSIGSHIRMLSPMISKMALCSKWTITTFELTAERFFACVNAHVRLKISVFCKSLAALCAFKWFLSSMSSLVNLQPTWTRVSLATRCTCIRLLAGMYKHMGLQVPFCDKSFATFIKIAQKRAVTSVGSHMSF